MKREHKAAIRERAREALGNLYHNATPVYPDFRNDFERDKFDSWFSHTAEFEIDYVQSGGAWCGSSTVEFVRKEQKSTAAGNYAARAYLRKRDLERAKYARWELISRYGKLYTYGRGGRTLAPADLIRQRGGSSFSIRADEIADEWSINDLIELILIVESFNKFVSEWCKSVPEQWEEEKKESGLNRRIWHYDGKHRVSRVRYA